MKKYFAVAAVFAMGLGFAACGGNDDKSADNPAVDETSTTVAASANTTLALSTSEEYGKYLVGANGMTLYLFEKDSGTTSACAADPCKANWPGLTSTGTPTVGEGVNASLTSTAAGQVPNQVTYNGHLLYYFAGDKAPGDVNGIHVPDWYPVDASGNKIDED